MTRDSLPDRPFFVLGCARSGTTLLQLMLHAHPRLAVPPETRFIPEAYRRRAEFGDLREPANLDLLVDWITQRRETKFRDLGVDAEVLRRRAHEVPPTLGSVLGAVLEQYAARCGKPRWGDKRPGYFRSLRELLTLFPDAQVIHIIRDGRDCVASLKRMPWWRHSVPVAAHYWMKAMRAGEWARASLPADQYVELHYEDLVLDPDGEVARLCAFLGEEPHEDMLRPQEQAQRAVPKRKRAQWHRRTTAEIDASAVGKWESGLEPEELRLVEFVAGRRLVAQGYELQGSGLRPPPAGLAADYARKAVRDRIGRQRQRRTERRLSREYPWPVAARLTSGQRALTAAP